MLFHYYMEIQPYMNQILPYVPSLQLPRSIHEVREIVSVLRQLQPYWRYQILPFMPIIAPYLPYIIHTQLYQPYLPLLQHHYYQKNSQLIPRSKEEWVTLLTFLCQTRPYASQIARYLPKLQPFLGDIVLGFLLFDFIQFGSLESKNSNAKHHILEYKF